MQFKHLDKFAPSMIKKQLQQLIFKVVHIKPNELKATLLSFCFVFLRAGFIFVVDDLFFDGGPKPRHRGAAAGGWLGRNPISMATHISLPVFKLTEK